MDELQFIIREGIRLSDQQRPFRQSQFIQDPQRWKSFLYVYGTTYSSNDRLLWQIPEDSDACKTFIVEVGDYLYLYYKEWDGQMVPIVFTHKKFIPQHTAFDSIDAWWN